jgi:hypothetical protein
MWRPVPGDECEPPDRQAEARRTPSVVGRLQARVNRIGGFAVDAGGEAGEESGWRSAEPSWEPSCPIIPYYQ